MNKMVWLKVKNQYFSMFAFNGGQMDVLLVAHTHIY